MLQQVSVMKSIGSSSNSISQSLREQVVQISIDIDDKTKIAKLLEKKIKQERLELSQIEDVSDVYTDRLNTIQLNNSAQ